jgi:chromosomal replication initiation ATPase DnaA
MTCRECGKDTGTEPAILFGRKINPPALCDPCLDIDLAAAEEERRRHEFLGRLNRSGLPREKQAIELEGPAHDLARQWALRDIPVLVLTGPVGTGKTHIAAGATWMALQSRSVRWVEVARVMAQLRASFGDRDRADALSALTGSDSVVLDDLDKAPATEQGLSMIFAAIDARIAEGSPLLITMNSSLGELARRLDPKDTGAGEAIASRLQVGRVISLAGTDRRVVAA